MLLTTLLTACGPTPAGPSPFAPFSQTDLIVGTGAEAVNGRTIKVQYTLWLYDPSKTDNKGLQLESSAGGDPFSFVLGRGQVIQGWDRGVAGMREGGRRRLIVPPSLGYGENRSAKVPPNATLLFDIDLLEVGAE